MSGFFVSFALPFHNVIFYPYYEKIIHSICFIYNTLRL